MPLVGSASKLLNWINPDPTCSNANNGFKGVLGCLGEFPPPPGHFVQNPRIPHLWLPAFPGCDEVQWSVLISFAAGYTLSLHPVKPPWQAQLYCPSSAGSSLHNFPHIKNRFPPTYPLQLAPSNRPSLSANVSIIVCPGFRLLVAIIVCNSADRLLVALKIDSFSSCHCKLLIQQYWLNPGPFSEYTLQLHHSHPHMCSYHLKCSFCWSLFHSSTPDSSCLSFVIQFSSSLLWETSRGHPSPKINYIHVCLLRNESHLRMEEWPILLCIPNICHATKS